jgi:hypothetical protein
VSLRSLIGLAIPIAVGVALGSGAGVAGAATTWTVTSTADPASGASCPSASNCTLREAINDAVDGDTISVPAGHITLAQGVLQVNASITIEGAGASTTTIDANNASRVITVIQPDFSESHATLTLKDLTVTGGSVTKASVAGNGGGAGIQVNSDGGLHLDGVTVTGNQFTVTTANGQNIGGAGIMSLSTVDLSNSTVSHNILTVGSAFALNGGGGVLVTSGDLILAGTAISDNTANITEGNPFGDNGGGGVLLGNGINDAIIEHSTLSGNALHLLGNQLAPNDGGGGLAFGGASILASDSTFSNNLADVGVDTQANGGGAIEDIGGGSAFTNDTFAGNSVQMTQVVVDQGGGAIYADSGIESFANDTFTGNSPGSGGTGASVYAEGTGLLFGNSILSSGAAGTANCTLDGGSTAVSDGYNLYDDTANTCTLSATGDQHVTSLGLGPLADNGGPVQTEAVQAGSPALNAGDPAGCVDAFGHGLATDGRGVDRPQPASGRCDIGAYEQAPPLALTGLAGGISAATVTLQGFATNPDAVAGSTHFEYGTTTSYGSSTTAQPVGPLAALSATASLADLPPGTYHYRLVAVNPDGTSDGADSTFTIPGAGQGTAPAVLTGFAKHLGQKRAVVTGELDGFGLATKYQFQYGTSRRYGRKTTLKSRAGANKVFEVSVALKGLKPGRTYHFRLVATNSAGKTNGSDQTFKTKPRKAQKKTA